MQYLQSLPELNPSQQQMLNQLQQQHAQYSKPATLPFPPREPDKPTTEAAADTQIPKDLSNVNDTELQELLSQKDIATCLAEDLLKQFAQGGLDFDLKDECLDNTNVKAEPPSSPAPTPAVSTAAAVKTEPPVKSEVKQEVKLPPVETVASVDPPVASQSSPPEDVKPPTFNINQNSSEIIKLCESIPKSGVINNSILSEAAPPPFPPTIPVKVTSEEELLPRTPSVLVESKKDCFSTQLSEFCLQHPIAVIRGMASALKLGKYVIS